MNLIITGNMGNGTIQAKLEPLSRLSCVDTIYFLRKTEGPKVSKTKYITLPNLCKIGFFNLLLTPLLLSYYTIRTKSSFIISYHIIPYAFIAAIAGFITRKPYFVCQTGLTIQNKIKNIAFWYILRRIILNCRKLCVPGSSSQVFWISKGIPHAKVETLHSTIDTDVYRPNPTLERRIDFVYTGRFAAEKRIDMILNAFSMVKKDYPESSLLLIGDGPLLPQMKNLASKLEINENTIFLGFQTRLVGWLQLSKFIIIASDTEGLPCSIMEGMSTGLIPISTNVGNISDVVINDNTGFLIDKDDAQVLANTMKSVFEITDEAAQKYSVNARKTIVEKHSHSYSAHKWESLLNS